MIKNKYAIRYSFILKSLGLWLLALEFFFFLRNTFSKEYTFSYSYNLCI